MHELNSNLETKRCQVYAVVNQTGHVVLDDEKH